MRSLAYVRRWQSSSLGRGGVNLPAGREPLLYLRLACIDYIAAADPTASAASTCVIALAPILLHTVIRENGVHQFDEPTSSARSGSDMAGDTGGLTRAVGRLAHGCGIWRR